MTATDRTPEIPDQYLLSAYASAPRTLIDILNETARRYPDAPAIDDGEVQLTYAELISDVEESVAWLGARGIGRGDRIGIRMPSGSYALYVAILATLAAGAAYVPVDPEVKMIHASSRLSGDAARQPRDEPGPRTNPFSVMIATTAASVKTRSARSWGSSASTGTYAAPAASVARIAT